MNDSITVHKLDEQGQEVWRYPGTVLERTDTHVKLEARFDREDVEFHGLHLRRGDRFVEVFYSNRWFNIFTIFDAEDDRLKGWYCNITRPAHIIEGHVFADDLALDLIVTAEGACQVMDREEFAALELTPEERQRALQALEKLQTMAAEGVGPFSPLA